MANVTVTTPDFMEDLAEQFEQLKDSAMDQLIPYLEMAAVHIQDLQNTEYMQQAEIAMRPFLLDHFPFHTMWLILASVFAICVFFPIIVLSFFRSAPSKDVEEELPSVKVDAENAVRKVLSAPSPIKIRRSTRQRKEVERFDPSAPNTPYILELCACQADDGATSMLEDLGVPECRSYEEKVLVRKLCSECICDLKAAYEKL
eukprot:gene661-486_t